MGLMQSVEVCQNLARVDNKLLLKSIRHYITIKLHLFAMILAHF